MQLTIQEKKDNVFLDRAAVQGELAFEGATPSNVEVATAIAKQLGVDATTVAVKHIYTKFGQQHAQFQALVYKTAEVRAKTERMTSHLRKKLDEQKKGEA